MLLLALFACNDACPDDDAVTLELGTGSLAFEDAPDGTVLEQVFGNQGGFHYDLMVRATGLTDDFDYDLTGTSDQDVVMDQTSFGRFQCDRATGRLEASLRMFPERAPDPNDPDGTYEDVEGPMEVTLALTDEDGETASATATWILPPI